MLGRAVGREVGSMDLTEEQKERIRVNRERALEIRRKREEEQKRRLAVEREEEERGETGGFVRETHAINTNSGEGVKEDAPAVAKKLTSVGVEEEEDDDIELEEFEKGASRYVTKGQAMKMYCLPNGTLSVCSYVEKSNPKQNKWSAMKLFFRSEIRRRARERFGGLVGLREERAKRELKRFERDYKSAGDIFEKKVKR